MTTNIIQTLFFDLIKVAIERKDSLSGTPTPEEWKEIYKLAKQQTHAGVLFSALEKLPKEQRPPRPLLLKWFAATEVIKEANNQVNADASKMCELIRKDGLRCVVLKGQGIATYYPNPSLRTCGDIDLWVEGGLKKIKNYIRTKGEVKGVIYTHIEYDAPVSTEVEIHHNPSYFYNPIYLWRMKKYFAKQTELFDNSIELPDNTGKIYVPSLEFNRYYILLHIYRHYFTEGIGLRQMLDYYYVLCKGGTKESKQRSLEIFKKTGMLGFLGATMWVMQEVFDLDNEYLLCQPNKKRGKQLLDEILVAGNFGKYDPRINWANKNKLLPRIWNSFNRKLKFITNYPQELLFDIPMRIYMYIWRHFV